jgi:3-hydroxybutyrate dehydrogenase
VGHDGSSFRYVPSSFSLAASKHFSNAAIICLSITPKRNSQMELKGKVALITGAGSGIGKEIALCFARAGAKIGVADITLSAADSTTQEINANGGQAVSIDMDVSNEEQVDGGVEKLIAAFGSVDVLVSNAGVQHIDPVDQLSFKDWKNLLAIHLDGAFLTTRACLRNMYKNNRGSIIYMGSVHSKEASKLKAPYVTAKHGLLGLCKVVAKEGAAHNVRANVICPGYVRTPLVDKQIPEQAKTLGISEEDVIKKVMLAETVDGEFTTTNDIAQVALFFASFPDNALTGQSLIASHGWFME